MILETCQRLLNQRILESTAAKQRLAALEGVSLAVEVTGLEIRIVVAVDGGVVFLNSARDVTTDATLRASPLELLTLARSSSLSQLKQTTASLDGKLHVVELFAEMLQFAKPDWEAEAAAWIGDIAAHEVGAVSRKVFDWGHGAFRALEQNTAEYLQQEDPVLARPRAVDAFVSDVDRLRDDVDRIAHRIELLAQARATRN